MTNAIVVPCILASASHMDTLEALLQSIIAGGTDKQCSVVLAHDATPDLTFTYIQEKYPQFIHLNHEGNRLNFAGNANKGLRYAYNELKADKLMVCNQDCVLPSWSYLKPLFMQEGLTSAESIDALDIEDYNETAKLVGLRQVEKFAGYCFVIDRKVIDKIGFFDESLVSTWEDDTLIANAHLAGFPVQVLDVYINHKGSHMDQNANGGSLMGSYNGERLVLNLQKFYWRFQIPGAVPHSEAMAWIRANHIFSPELYEP